MYFLFAVLVFERDLVAFYSLHHLRHGRVGRGAIGHEIPGLVTFTGTAQCLGKNVDLDRLLGAVGLRHPGHADKRILLDVGERRLDDASHRRVIRPRNGGWTH